MSDPRNHPFSNRNYDIAIIGASLAGSSLALALGRTGASILLIDRDTFPRRKACGEGLSNHGVAILQSLGVNLAEVPHQPLDGYRIESGARESRVPLLGSCGEAQGGIGVSRAALDNALIEQVRTFPNVTLLLGTKVKTCTQTSQGCFLTLSAPGDTDSTYSVSARLVAIAAGGRTRIGRFPYPHALGGTVLTPNSPVRPINGHERPINGRYGSSQRFLAHYRDGFPTEVRIVAGRGFEVYATPIDDGMVNLAVMSSKSRFAEISRKAGRAEIISMLERRWSAELTPFDEPLSTGPIQNVIRKSTEGRFYFVGDACEQFDPIGGMGMTHAILSGILAAQSIDSVLTDRCLLSRAAVEYDVARYRAAMPLRGFTRLAHFMIVNLASSRVSEARLSLALARQISRAVHCTDARPTTKFAGGILRLAGR